MQSFEFKVKVEATSNARAKQVLKAMFDIKKALNDSDLLLLAKAIKEKPNLIKKAKMFL